MPDSSASQTPSIPAQTPASALDYATPAALPTNPNAKVSVFFGVSCLTLIGLSLLMLTTGVKGEQLWLMLGILALTTSLIAMASGIHAWKRSRRGEVASAGLAITGIALGAAGLITTMLIAYAILNSSIGVSRESANRAKCLRNLKVIGDAIQLYANENKGALPPNFEALMLSQDIFPGLFICPSSNDDPATGNTIEEQAANLSKGHCSYIYLGAGKNMNMLAHAPTNLVIAYEPLTNHYQAGMHVLFADFRVQFIPNPQAKKTTAELQAGQNPSPSYR